ncbi:MAG: gliding motility-associated C-terminal domain-containing protein [Flavobacteriales bacterium]|nr:gliding motility-associated C-terminal domain-containing protein [Flavobacteriales bacterium]
MKRLLLQSTRFSIAVLLSFAFFGSAKAQCPVVIDSVIVTNVTCSGANDGTICVYASGGFPTYIFQIFNGPQFFHSPDGYTGLSYCFTGLGAGISSWVVQVVGEDGSGGTCAPIPSTSVLINDPDPFDIQITTTDETCPDSNDGTASVVVTGGFAPYSYSWLPFAGTGTSISGLNSGTYDLVVTDANSCSQSVQYTINQEPDWAGTLTGTNVTCNGGTDGEIVSSGITGGTPPLSFLWTPDGQVTEDINTLSAGNYTLTVTDDVGCTFTPPTVVIAQPSPIVINESQVNVSCDGLQDGSINITVSGGVAPYTYQWSNGAITEDINVLGAGFYLVTVTDDNGCTAALPITILDGSSLNVSFITTTAQCGEANGNIDLTVVGGSGSYAYNWQPGGQTSQDVSGLLAGIYTVIVTDNVLGCADTLDILLNNIPGHTVDGVVTDGSNCIANDGSIDATVTGGSGDFTYGWSSGPVTEDITGLATGTYIITVTDNIMGCVSFASFNVQSGSEIITNAALTQPSCGLINGAINLTVGGGSGPYTFIWSNSATTEDLSSLTSGIYAVTITDVNGCTSDEVYNLSEVDGPDVTATVISPICTNTEDGSITLVLTGGVGPFAFNWSTGATVQNLTGLSGGTYTVIVTDQGSGCVAIESFTLVTPSPMGGNVNLMPVGCDGDSDGSIDVTIFGGVAPYSYLWNPGAITTEDLAGISAGTYTVTVTDAVGCSIFGQFNVAQSPPIVINETHQNVSCSGAANGSINLTVSGGVGGFTYAWLPDGQTTEDLSGLSGGTYDVTVTDTDGCTQTASITINEPTTFQLNPSSTDASCNGVCDGTAGVIVSGGTLPYTYSWTPPAGNVPSVSGLCGGNYQVVVTDANGCSDVAQFSISSNQIQVSIVATNASCNGDCDGTLTATVTGTNAPFTYQWLETGGTGLSESGLCPGTYTFEVTDGIGCTVQQPVTITEPDPILISMAVTDVSCNGGSDGSIDMTVSGGTAPYIYQWFPGGQTTEDITNLPEGDYSVVVTDANGCTSSQIVLGGSFAGGTLALPDGSGVSYSTTVGITGFPANSTITSATDLQDVCINMEHSYLGDLQLRLICPNGQSVILKEYPGGTGTYLGAANDAGANGIPGTGADYCFSASATWGTLLQENALGNWVTAGNAPNNSMTPGTYSPFQSFNNFIGCPLNGTWTIQVTDNLGIDDGFIFGWDLTFGGSGANDSLATVNEPTPIQISSTVTDASCGVCDGSVTVSASNGLAPYSYLWNTGATTATLNNICAGVYQVQVTDANGCTNEFFVPVDNIAGPTAGNPVITDATCFGGCDGAATLSPVGGTAPYTYQWVPGGQSTNSVSGLCTGTYFVQIRDAASCIYTETVTIGSPAQIQIGQTVTNSGCGLCDGAITLTPITGVAPYTYDWSPAVAGNVPDATGLCAGVYNITVTDATGCSEPVTVLLNDFPSATLFMSATDPGCNNGCDGTATVATFGGTAPFFFVWDDPLTQTNATSIDLCTGLYTVTVTDADGCVAVGQVTLDNPAPIGLSLLIIDNGTCAGNCDGSITVIPSGGTIPFTYLWDDSNGQTSATAVNLCAGIYSVTVTDANGCTDVVTGTVNNPVGLTATVVGTDANCNGICDGTATVTVQGGTAPFTYLWDDPAAQTTAVATALCAGTYSATVTDANNCSFTVSITIDEPDLIAITFSNVINLQCDGVCAGQATANISGGVGPYSVVWNDALAQTTQTATGLCASSYTITVTDANGCVQTATVVITGPGGLTSSVTSQVNATCNGDCNATATVTATGGTAPYSYQWNDPASQTGQTATGLCAGIYTVTVTDDNGCVSATTVTIAQPGVLNASTTANDPDCYGICDGTSTAFTTGGTFPYSYLWNDPNGQTTITSVGLCPGPYSVTVTDANGCVDVASVNIFQPTQIIANSNVVNATCGQCNGQASVSPTGGVQPYTYLWGDGQTTATVTGLCPGVYNVDVIDAFGCVSNFIIPVNNDGGATSATINTTGATCFGNCDGSASVSNVVGGVAPYTYLWVPGGQTAASVTGLCAGAYNVQVIDDLGCIFTQQVVIAQPAQIVPNYVSTPAACGNADGTITVNPTGGDGGPYTYLWVPVVSATNTATGLASGVYTVTITDGSGCTATTVIPVNNMDGPNVTASATPANCNGVCDGTATVTITGGTAPYTVLWNDPAGQTTNTATALCAGQYSVTVTDANGCVSVRQVTVTEPTQLSFSLPIISDAQCNSACDGQITVVTSGGTLPYTVVWSPAGGNLPTATGLCAGTYTALVTDANGCTASLQAIVGEPDTLVTAVTPVDASCFGVCDGEATAVPTGGTAPYTYQWNDPANTTTNQVTGLCAGTYICIVTDANGCSDTATVIISEPAAIVITPTAQGTSCFGDCDGEAYASVTGGSAPYTYQWNDPALTANDTVTGLCAGIYNIIVTDDNGCTATVAVIITEPDPLIASGQGVDASCPGVCDGSATALVQGGTGPYTYLWDDPNAQTTVTATGLCAGTYNVTVTDANGCSDVTSVTINEPAALDVNVTVVDASCNGVCDGEASATVSGGSAPYTLLWSNGSSTNPVTGLCVGSYTLLVTDANGCTETVSFNVGEPDAIIISTSTLDASCFGTCDGEAYASATGGSGVFAFVWSDLNTTANDTVTALCAGSYTVTVTDDTGCSATAQVIINQPLDITITAYTQGVSCFGDCNGQAFASASGGTGPYTYQWDDVNLTANDTVIDLCPGIYNVIVTDANGCTSTTAVIITEPLPLQLVGVPTNISCGGQCNGVATVLVQGGTPQYTYQWNDPQQQTGASATGLCAGTFTVIVTDDNGCIDSVDVTITEPPVLDVTVTVVNPSCGGVCDGEASVTINGGTGPYTILWSDFSSGSSIIGLCAGNYSVIVVDANMCSDSVNFILTEPPVLNANITATTQVLCSGSCTGAATVEGSGGTPPYSYQWSNGQTTPTATNLCVGQYSVIITDDIGCTATAIVTINDDNALAAAVPVFTSVSCFGDCNGTATVFATGGVGPFTYSWNDLFNQTAQTAINLCPGTYTVTVVDSQTPACTTQASVTIDEPAVLTSTTSATDESCGGACNGTATAAPQGGTQPYSYLWSDPSNQTLVTATGLCVGTYTVTITDANGCSVQNSVTVSGPPAIMANATTVASTCSNVANGSIDLTVAGGVGGHTFLWNPGGGVTEDLSNILFGTYAVTITDATGCQLVAQYSVGTLTNIVVDAGEDMMLCVGSSLTLNGSGGGNYSWTPSETLSNASAANPTANPVESTTYVLTVSIGNCVDVDSVNVTMYDMPQVDAGNDVTIPTGGTIGLNANGAVTGWQYAWSPSESLDDPNITNPAASPLETTMYYVTVTDDNGCTNVDSVLVEVVPGIKFPDGISPNGDGINDTWIIDNIELFQDAIVEIYNRWGQMLWQSAPGYPIPWDGRYKGEDLPVGTYYYVIRSDNFDQPFTGPITIVR